MSPFVKHTAVRLAAVQKEPRVKLFTDFTVSLVQEVLPSPSLKILSLIRPKHLHSSPRPRITDKCSLTMPLPCCSPLKLLTFLRVRSSPSTFFPSLLPRLLAGQNSIKSCEKLTDGVPGIPGGIELSDSVGRAGCQVYPETLCALLL